MAGKSDDWKGMVIWKMPEWIEPVVCLDTTYMIGCMSSS